MTNLTKLSLLLLLAIDLTFSIAACSPSIPDSSKELPNTPARSMPIVTPQLPTETPIPITETAAPVGVKNEIAYKKLDLIWLECEAIDWEQGKQCLGIEMPKWQAEDKKKRWGERYVPGTQAIPNFRLIIEQDVYDARYWEYKGGIYYYVLKKNGKPIAEANGDINIWQNGWYLNKSLLNVDGRVAWEVVDFDHPTVIFDGINLADKYELEAAYYPNTVNNKLIFVAKKDGRYFIMYDEQPLGPDFDSIAHAYPCCESHAYFVSRPPNQYWFWGSKDGKNYLVAIIGK